MDSHDDAVRWERLTMLLRPIHQQAAATARRLSRSAHDGDDLYQEAVLRAHGKLGGLRDESRFRSWFFAVLLSVHRSRVRRPRREMMGLEDTLETRDEPIGDVVPAAAVGPPMRLLPLGVLAGWLVASTETPPPRLGSAVSHAGLVPR